MVEGHLAAAEVVRYRDCSAKAAAAWRKRHTVDVQTAAEMACTVRFIPAAA